MAQSVRRPETLGAMDRDIRMDKNRTSYFGNVKTRSGFEICTLLGNKAQQKAPMIHSYIALLISGFMHM